MNEHNTKVGHKYGSRFNMYISESSAHQSDPVWKNETLKVFDYDKMQLPPPLGRKFSPIYPLNPWK